MALKGFLLAWIALGSAAHLLKCRANRPAADNPPIPALQLPRLVNQYDSSFPPTLFSRGGQVTGRVFL